MSKPDLVLHWTYDIPNQKLYIKIADNLEYEAIEGGSKGYNKTYNNVVTHVSDDEWNNNEKYWISEQYGEKYGYYQQHPDLWVQHPEQNWKSPCLHGLGKDGEYLDHMQRSMHVLEGHDCATIWHDRIDYRQYRANATAPTVDLYVTPDKGHTIYVRRGYNDVVYDDVKKYPDRKWVMHPQPCMMQPRTKGYQLSSHKELENAGCPINIVDRCKRGEWEEPRFPELQQYYIYPTA